MGVMTNKDYEIAVLNNLKDWDFEVNPQYPLEKKEAEAVVGIIERYFKFRETQQLIKERRGM